jgi:hypothetical protein
MDPSALIGEASFANQGRAVTAHRNQGLVRHAREDAVLIGAAMHRVLSIWCTCWGLPSANN